MDIVADLAGSVASFNFNEGEYVRLLQGPVMGDLVRRAIRVQALAKQNATGRPGPNVITGRLRGSIAWRPGGTPTDPYVDVGTNVHYAPFVERRYPFLRPALPAAAA